MSNIRMIPDRIPVADETLVSRVWRDAFNAAIAASTDAATRDSSGYAVRFATDVADRALEAWMGRQPKP